MTAVTNETTEPSTEKAPVTELGYATEWVEPPTYDECSGDLTNACTYGNFWKWYDYSSKTYVSVVPVSAIIVGVVGFLTYMCFILGWEVPAMLGLVWCVMQIVLYWYWIIRPPL